MTLDTAAASTPSGSLVGRVIDGRYRLEEEIGSGIAGATYRARRTEDSRLVVLKLFDEDVSGDPVRRSRFEWEAATLAGLAHPNVVPILDYGVFAGRRYLVSEWLEGESLAIRMRRAQLPLTAAVGIIRQVLAALASVHSARLAHRNLKPTDVYLEYRKQGRERVKLLDFAPVIRPARSQLTAAGRGSYVPPELLEGAALDARSDVYAVGALLSGMLHGGPPDTPALAGPTSAGARKGPVVDSTLQGWIRRAMARDRQERFADAAEMLQQLIDLLPRDLRSPPESYEASRVSSVSIPAPARTDTRRSETARSQVIPSAGVASSIPPEPAQESVRAPSYAPQAPNPNPVVGASENVSPQARAAFAKSERARAFIEGKAAKTRDRKATPTQRTVLPNRPSRAETTSAGWVIAEPARPEPTSTESGTRPAAWSEASSAADLAAVPARARTKTWSGATSSPGVLPAEARTWSGATSSPGALPSEAREKASAATPAAVTPAPANAPFAAPPVVEEPDIPALIIPPEALEPPPPSPRRHVELTVAALEAAALAAAADAVDAGGRPEARVDAARVDEAPLSVRTAAAAPQPAAAFEPRFVSHARAPAAEADAGSLRQAPAATVSRTTGNLTPPSAAAPSAHDVPPSAAPDARTGAAGSSQWQRPKAASDVSTPASTTPASTTQAGGVRAAEPTAPVIIRTGDATGSIPLEGRHHRARHSSRPPNRRARREAARRAAMLEREATGATVVPDAAAAKDARKIPVKKAPPAEARPQTKDEGSVRDALVGGTRRWIARVSRQAMFSPALGHASLVGAGIVCVLAFAAVGLRQLESRPSTAPGPGTVQTAPDTTASSPPVRHDAVGGSKPETTLAPATAPSKPAEDAPAVAAAVSGRNARVPAINPWADPLPPELDGLPELASKGDHGSDETMARLRAYSRFNEGDARGLLLLGRFYMNRYWRGDALAEYQLAIERDPAVRGAPEIMSAIIECIVTGKNAEKAEELLMHVYGREALPPIELALERLQKPLSIQRLSAVRTKLLDRP